MLKAVKKAGKLGKKVEGYVAKLKQPKQQAAAPTYFIMEEKSARIKCVDPLCSVRIHENDVRALLDEMEVGLDDCISVEHRRYLLYKHDYHSVIFGLGTENVQTCPLCKGADKLWRHH
ncbi:hypothetical protein WR25_20062 [Diploscapter pachys]|uniref:Uncharacterized protein n=1 Tax=Diploscapter pachys TaxID=2018661 RepID=A0A2A2KK95_9BILA|nr:hypothetical protein WR25_20062 [Diploscapter pachys]